MTPQEVYKHFGTSYQFCKQTGMSSGNIFNWIKKGHVPIESQHKIEKVTNGELKANYGDIPQ